MKNRPSDIKYHMHCGCILTIIEIKLVCSKAVIEKYGFIRNQVYCPTHFKLLSHKTNSCLCCGERFKINIKGKAPLHCPTCKTLHKEEIIQHDFTLPDDSKYKDYLDCIYWDNLCLDALAIEDTSSRPCKTCKRYTTLKETINV